MEKIFSIGIIDDEQYSLDLLEKYLEEIEGVRLAFSEQNPVIALDIIQQQAPDILLVDVKMPRVNGIQLARSIKKMKIPVILVTAYSEFAAPAFEMDEIVDFLLKPFTLKRLKKAVSIAKVSVANLRSQEGILPIKSGKANLEAIYILDVLYIQADREYIKIYTKNGYRIIQISMNRLMDLLQTHSFLRIHRSYIVNRHEVIKFSYTNIKLSDGTLLPIGRTYQSQIRKIMFSRN